MIKTSLIYMAKFDGMGAFSKNDYLANILLKLGTSEKRANIAQYHGIANIQPHPHGKKYAVVLHQGLVNVPFWGF